MTPDHQATLDIVRALGLDPAHVRCPPEPTITLTKDHGPVLQVELFLFDRNGKHYTVDGENVAAELRRYRLVPLEDLPTAGYVEPRRPWYKRLMGGRR